MHRTRAPEGDQAVSGRVGAGFRDVHARSRRHVVVDDLGDAGRRLVEAEPELLAEPRKRGARPPGIEPHAPAEKAFGREVAAHEVGIGHGRLFAALAVAGRAGNRAGAARTDAHEAEPVGRRDAAPAGADLDELDHRQAQREAAALLEALQARRLELVAPMRPPVVDQADLGGRAAHVEGDHVPPFGLPAQEGRAHRTRGGPRFDERDRLLAGVARRGDAAVRQHDEQRHAEQAFELDEVAHGDRRHIGVGDRGREALVFADFRRDLRRGADRDSRTRCLHERLGGKLMSGIAIAVEEGDGERAGARGDEFLGGGAHARFVERHDDVAFRTDAFLHRLAKRTRDERRRPFELEIESVVAKLVADLEHVAIAVRGDQPDGRAASLDQGIGDQRRAMHHLAGGSLHGSQAFEDGACADRPAW